MKYELNRVERDLGTETLSTGATGRITIGEKAGFSDWLLLSFVAFILWVVGIGLSAYLLGFQITVSITV